MAQLPSPGEQGQQEEHGSLWTCLPAEQAGEGKARSTGKSTGAKASFFAISCKAFTLAHCQKYKSHRITNLPETLQRFLVACKIKHKTRNLLGEIVWAGADTELLSPDSCHPALGSFHVSHSGYVCLWYFCSYTCGPLTKVLLPLVSLFPFLVSSSFRVADEMPFL